MTISDLRWIDLEYIAFNMREIDRREIYGNLPSDNPLQLTAMLMQQVAQKGVGWIAHYDGRPAAWLAVFEQWPGNWQITLAGTDSIGKVMFALREKVTAAFRFAIENGAHRVECRNLVAHREAEVLVRKMRARLEGRLTAYGRDGDDYHQWAWTGESLARAAKEVSMARKDAPAIKPSPGRKGKPKIKPSPGTGKGAAKRKFAPPRKVPAKRNRG